MTDAAGENTSPNPPTSNVPDSLIVFHHSELSKLEAEEQAAKDVVKKIAARKKKYRTTIKADGVKLKNFDRAREILLADDDDEVRNDLAEQGALSCVGCRTYTASW